MATEAQQPLKVSYPASAALAASIAGGGAGQYLFVKRDTAGRVILCTAATDAPVGVLQNKPIRLDDACEIVVIGFTKIITTTAGTAFSTFLDGVAPYTDGTAQKATPTGTGGSYVQGTKAAVGKIAPVGGTGIGLPAAADVTRIVINCAIPPVPAT